MKFMKLGSKPDTFQTDGNNVRYVASELASDIAINVGDVKFYLHKFPLLSKSATLQKLVSNASEGNSDEVDIHDIPGGPSAFEICAKFCYGMTVTLNAYNVISTRCAAEYLSMNESLEKGNLIYKIDVFLNSSIFRSWKDSIIVLQTTKSQSRMCEELKLTSHCIDAVASRASVDVSRVDWSYTYNRKKLPEENGNDPNLNGIRCRMVPKDWWVEDLCELEVDLYKRVVITIKNKGIVSSEAIGEAAKAYAYRRFPGFNKGAFQFNDVSKCRPILDTVVWLLPSEKGCVSCSFLFKLLKASISLDSGETVKAELVKRIGQQLEESSVNDLLIRAADGEGTMYDAHVVQKILEAFMMRDKDSEPQLEDEDEIQEVRKPGILSEASKLMVAKLVDGYLTEIARDPNLPISTFVGLAEMVSNFPRPGHDGIYRAIDMYLKEHPGISKSERKRICKLMDCKKLSVDACMHAVQNERLPLRVVVQVLFFEQVRANASSGSSTPDLPKAIRDLNSTSYGSSRSATTNTEEDWDAAASAEELRALRGELAALRMGNGGTNDKVNVIDAKSHADRAAMSKMKGLLMSKRLFSKIWSNKGGQGENSGSDSSESLGSANNLEEAKSTPAALFQSLLFEACGRTVNPVHGAVGLLWTGNWHVCQSAVETVLKGGVLRPLPEFSGVTASPEFDSEANDVDLFRSQSSNFRSKRKIVDEVSEDLDLGLTSGSSPMVAGGKLNRRTEKRRAATPSLNSDESDTTTLESGFVYHQNPEQGNETKLLRLFF